MSQPEPSAPRPDDEDQKRIVVVSEDGMAVGGGDGDDDSTLMDLVQRPDKVMRIGAMTRQLLEEVRSAPLDEGSRGRLADIYARSVTELKTGLAPELGEELDRLTLPFGESATPTESELRVAQGQLVGWLEGLFQGIQTALVAQQMAARAQLDQMRQRALPPGVGMPGLRPGEQPPGRGAGSGPYL